MGSNRMRNPLKTYYFFCFERYDDAGALKSKHWRSTWDWFWKNPNDVFRCQRDDLCKSLNCDPSDLVLVAFNKI